MSDEMNVMPELTLDPSGAAAAAAAAKEAEAAVPKAPEAPTLTLENGILWRGLWKCRFTSVY